MSPLMMALMAGMMLGSNETEGGSPKTEQRLAIAGEWAGTAQGCITGKARVWSGVLHIPQEDGSVWTYDLGWIDEGHGRCRLVWCGDLISLGIYKREAGALYISAGRFSDNRRPTTFQGTDTTFLLILKPVKPKPKK